MTRRVGGSAEDLAEELRVLVVDDHRLIRYGVRQMLMERAGAIVGEAGTAAAAWLALQTGMWDVVVLDLGLPDRSGLELLKDIRAAKPQLPVLVLSMHQAEQYVRRAMDAGAMGYLTKDSEPEEIVNAVLQVRKGRRFLNATTRLALASSPCTHEALSHREFQVMELLVEGRTVTQIARHLQVSVKTISTYRARLLNKLGIRTTAELMHYALRERLLE